MKCLKQFILESNNKNDVNTWLENVKKMYDWYCKNFKNFYDGKHQYNSSNYKECELLNNKKVVADCSGFVAACLCLSGYTDDTINWNVRLGSFNKYKNHNVDINVEEISKFDEKFKDKLLYITDINDFECHKISDEKKEKQDYTEIKAGDIIVKGSHVTIAATDGGVYLYDWGKQITTQTDDVFKKSKPVKFYIPKDKNTTFPYRSYWRLK